MKKETKEFAKDTFFVFWFGAILFLGMWSMDQVLPEKDNVMVIEYHEVTNNQ